MIVVCRRLRATVRLVLGGGGGAQLSDGSFGRSTGQSLRDDPVDFTTLLERGIRDEAYDRVRMGLARIQGEALSTIRVT